MKNVCVLQINSLFPVGKSMYQRGLKVTQSRPGLCFWHSCRWHAGRTPEWLTLWPDANHALWRSGGLIWPLVVTCRQTTRPWDGIFWTSLSNSCCRFAAASTPSGHQSSFPSSSTPPHRVPLYQNNGCHRNVWRNQQYIHNILPFHF